MTATSDPLGPVDECPLGERCEACGSGQDLDVATYQTPVGVFCATACGPCIDQATPPPVRAWATACGRVAAHCGHLGIDLDQMAATLHAEPDQEVTW
ncbi:MAG TPA: hypothetical protein VGM21_00385 [Actinomycetota bacterium]|jgi:hypothetical protein